MNISINNHTVPQSQRNSGNSSDSTARSSGEGFLVAAKKMFSVLSAVPAEPAEKYAAAHFKKIKEKNKLEKKRTEEDALCDIEKLIRRTQKNKSCADQSRHGKDDMQELRSKQR